MPLSCGCQALSSSNQTLQLPSFSAPWKMLGLVLASPCKCGSENPPQVFEATPHHPRDDFSLTTEPPSLPLCPPPFAQCLADYSLPSARHCPRPSPTAGHGLDTLIANLLASGCQHCYLNWAHGVRRVRGSPREQTPAQRERCQGP